MLFRSSVTFKKHPVTNDLVTVKDKSAINQSIANLLLTYKGERPFQPSLGSGIYKTLFEPLDYGTAAILKGEVLSVLNRYEPRIAVIECDIEIDYDTNGYNIEIIYVILGREDTPIGLDIFLERTR